MKHRFTQRRKAGVVVDASWGISAAASEAAATPVDAVRTWRMGSIYATHNYYYVVGDVGSSARFFVEDSCQFRFVVDDARLRHLSACYSFAM